MNILLDRKLRSEKTKPTPRKHFVQTRKTHKRKDHQIKQRNSGGKTLFNSPPKILNPFLKTYPTHPAFHRLL